MNTSYLNYALFNVCHTFLLHVFSVDVCLRLQFSLATVILSNHIFLFWLTLDVAALFPSHSVILTVCGSCFRLFLDHNQENDGAENRTYSTYIQTGVLDRPITHTKKGLD